MYGTGVFGPTHTAWNDATDSINNWVDEAIGTVPEPTDPTMITTTHESTYEEWGTDPNSWSDSSVSHEMVGGDDHPIAPIMGGDGIGIQIDEPVLIYE